MSLTRPQHLVALDRANEVHRGRGAAKRAIRAGRMSVVEAMDLDCCASMRLFDLLMVQNQFGEVRVNRFFRDLEHAGVIVGSTRTVGELTSRQCSAVIGLLEGKCAT